MGGFGSKTKKNLVEEEKKKADEQKNEQGSDNEKPKKINQIAPEPSTKVATEGQPKTPRERRRRSSVDMGVAPEPEDVLRLNKVRMEQTRTVRVFISSTFRDFALERDYLMRHALPELRKFGESRGVTVVFVDLRWGVTSEESSGGAVVKLCLQEIDACRPFFVGMLGERYGWHLDPEREDSLLEMTMDTGQKLYPWVEDFRNCSVTELEMLHGALLKPELAEFVTFYFRQHDKFKTTVLSQHPDIDKACYESETPYAKRGQDALKEKIRNVFPKNITEYADLKVLCETLVSDIKRSIEAEFPLQGSMDQYDFLDLQHEAFAASRRMGYVAQNNIYQELDAACTKIESVALIGASGLGKSAALANWVTHAGKSNKNALVFTHYVGCTTESTNYHHIIRRILAFFAKKLSIDLKDFTETGHGAGAGGAQASPREKRPDVEGGTNDGEEEKEDSIANQLANLTEDKLLEIMSDFLVAVVAKSRELGKKPVIIIDGLDQLEDKSNAHSLYWIPDVPGIVYLCAMKDTGMDHKSMLVKGPSERKLEDLNMKIDTRVLHDEAAQVHRKTDTQLLAQTVKSCWAKREWTMVPMDELEQDDQRQVIVEYLREHAKKLDEHQLKMVLAASPAQNPLYLRTLLDEARLFGNFFALTEHLGNLLEAKTSQELFRLVLKRMSSECGAEATLWAIGIILCARDGVTDHELREILALEFAGSTNKLPQFVLDGDTAIRSFVQLLFGLREQLCSTSGFLRFFHDAVKDAVMIELGEDDLEQALAVLHTRLALHFGKSLESTDITEDERETRQKRQMREYPFHLALSDQDLMLAKYLSQVDVMETMLEDESRKYELLLYWRQINNTWTSKYKPGDKDQLTGRPLENVEEYLNTVAQESKQGCDLAKFATLSGSEADDMKPGLLHASKTLGCVSTLLVLLGLYDRAVTIRQDEIAFSTAVYGQVHDRISISCSELADVYEQVYSKFDASLKLKQRALEIDRQLYGEENRQMAVGYDNLAFLHLKLGDYNKAREMYNNSLRIKEKLCGKFHRDVAQTCGAMGLLMEELCNIAEAKQWYQRSLDIRVKTFGPAHPSVARSQIDMGMLLLKEDSANVRDDVLPLVTTGYNSLIEALGKGHSDVAAAANNLGLVYSRLEEFNVALKYHLEAKKTQLVRLGEDHPAYAATCTNIGSVCQELAEQSFRRNNNEEEEAYFNSAEEHYSRAILIYKVKIGDKHPELATAQQNLGTLYFDSVTRDINRVKDWIAETDGKLSAEMIADIKDVKEKITGSLEEAIRCFTEAEIIRKEVFGATHETTLATTESKTVCEDQLGLLQSTDAMETIMDELAVASGGVDDGDDMLEAFVNDHTKVETFVMEVIQQKFNPETTTIIVPSVQMDTILDKLSQHLMIELPTSEDVERALKSLQLETEHKADVPTIAKIIQTILKQVYIAYQQQPKDN